ncbi:MAG: peptide deformylase [Parcubacteria group bacterium]|nr:peptide deformylase [Parcubacteria group bacterium]
MFTIVTIATKESEAFLRKKTKEVSDPHSITRGFVGEMKKTMIATNGIGLAANQIGEECKVFVATHAGKFYTLINPEIIKSSSEEEEGEEGCLSVPMVYGPVKRATKITIQGTDMRGKFVKIKAVGLLARIFQHEMDHLNGKLFIDKATSLYRVDGEVKA